VLTHLGKLDILVPSTDGRGAFQDPTHVSFWNINSFYYYQKDDHRKLYGIKAKFSGQMCNILIDALSKIVYCQGILRAIK
jgi:hypothetical protein